jgi:hypothetical protein
MFIFFLYVLVSHLQSEGYYGGARLLMTICKVFYNHRIQNNINFKAENFTLLYDTNIPQQLKFMFLSSPCLARLYIGGSHFRFMISILVPSNIDNMYFQLFSMLTSVFCRLGYLVRARLFVLLYVAFLLSMVSDI